jgi:hypothetical protein
MSSLLGKRGNSEDHSVSPVRKAEPLKLEPVYKKTKITWNPPPKNRPVRVYGKTNLYFSKDAKIFSEKRMEYLTCSMLDTQKCLNKLKICFQMYNLLLEVRIYRFF